eukprot:RCo006808
MSITGEALHSAWPLAGGSPAMALQLRRRIGFSIRLVMVASMCLFTIGPAVALWMVSWHAGTSGVADVHAQSQSSVEDVTVTLREYMMVATQTAFMALVEPTEALVLAQALRLKGSGAVE